VAHCHLVLFEQDVERVNAALDVFLKETEAQCVLLLDKGGQLIAVRGLTDTMDTTSLSALAAGAFASTREIARLIGEPEFSVLFHQGRREHIHVSLVDRDTLLMAIFDDRTTIGMIRLYAKDTEEQIAQLFDELRRQPDRGAQVLEDLGRGDADTPFPPGPAAGEP
jgi:predicted regulator of Ras-like GTPase activity (Roadblock/LC7/MglB family)